MRRLRFLVLAALAIAACDVCGLVNQWVVVSPDDPDLGGLISDCLNGLPPPAAATCPPASINYGEGQPKEILSACLPLCQRVYAIVNPDPHRPELVGCSFGMCNGQARIRIEYRSVCQ